MTVLAIVEVNSDTFEDSAHLRVCGHLSVWMGGNWSHQLHLLTFYFVELKALPSGSWEN